MMSTSSKDALARQIELGEYVVDVHAVAEAMVQRAALADSAVLVAPQALHRTPVGAEQDEAAAGDDVA